VGSKSVVEATDKFTTTPTRLPWSTPTVTVVPQAQSAEATFVGAGDLHVDAQRHHDLNLDGPPPLSGQSWLKDAVERLKSAPDCPQRVTDAGRRLEPEMAEAFLRRQCDEAWIAQSIENNLIAWGWWPRTRPRKG
jgi:hypothetical protein